MTRHRRLFFVALIWIACVWWSGPRAQSRNEPARSDSSRYGAVIGQYCATCHNARLRTAGLSFDDVDLTKIAGRADHWEKVVRKLRAGAMPPVGAPRPDAATRDGFISWLESELDRAGAANPDPGQPLIRRFNRAEYANAIRDLLSVDADVTSLLPVDDSSYGFDNIGDVLGVSPVLAEQYLSAAAKISAVAVGDSKIDPIDVTYRPAPDTTQNRHVDGLPLGTRGGILVRHTFPVDGEYVIRPSLWRSNSGFIRGLVHRHETEITVDGERVHLQAIGGETDLWPLIHYPVETGTKIDERLQVRVAVKAGPRSIGVTFIEKSAARVAPEVLQPFESALDPFDSYGLPQVDTLIIGGPFSITGPGDTPSRRRIFVCRPQRATEEAACARQILTTLARRAYRRPVTRPDVDLLFGFYETGRKKGSFDAGIQLALRRILTDPEFIFRLERDPAGATTRAVRRINDLELATRLSFFLWSSIPDDELLELASRGRLSSPPVLEAQTRRMLASSKSQALVTNFAAQWLQVRNLRNVSPDRIAFPDFDDNLRQAFRREMELFFESIIREDRNVLDLLTADYTFVNERLARHYGIPHVYGSHFRRVVLADEARRGLLGKGSVLAVTSYPNRTSPVVRGKWILENLLGTPLPPPPPDVDTNLEEDRPGEKPRTLRERFEAHRRSPSCAGCHRLMDPPGFALENFDAVGAWRTRDAGLPIDTDGELPDGVHVDGPATLRAALLQRRELFIRAMTEKLLTYALGRGLAHADMPVVRTIVRQAELEDYRFSSLVMGIVRSIPFQMRRPVSQQNERVAP
jgi:mono/diheme cytochrome c family protein